MSRQKQKFNRGRKKHRNGDRKYVETERGRDEEIEDWD